MVARVLSDSVRKKISIISGCKGLQEFIALDQLPVEYEGTGPNIGQAQEHLQFLELAKGWNVSENISGAGADAGAGAGSAANSDSARKALTSGESLITAKLIRYL